MARTGHGRRASRAGELALLALGATGIVAAFFVWPDPPAATPRVRAEETSPDTTVLAKTEIATRVEPVSARESRFARLIAALRDDDIPLNATRAHRALCDAGPATHVELRAALAGDDPQQRLFCAMILAQADPTDTAALDELIAHLADNVVPGDAKLAAATLRNLGPPVVPRLRAARATVDPQARAFIARLERELSTPLVARSVRFAD